jgi:hypothetical protein
MARPKSFDEAGSLAASMGGLKPFSKGSRLTLPGKSACTLWLVVLASYGLIYGALLLSTHGYPYVSDNNESFSNLVHAHNLAHFGLKKSFGLTDESYAVTAAGHPYIHSHQGNFPRLFNFVLYLLGLRSVQSQIWVTTFTVGLAAIYLAFSYFKRVGNELFATIACLTMLSDYLLFAQWQVNTYRVWHGFFFFSSLLCIHGIGGRRPELAWVLGVLNFAALFYWEYVYASFIGIYCGIYGLILFRRQWRRLLWAWGSELVGAGFAAGTLIAQLTAYMGWKNVLLDIHYTLHARNSAADQVLTGEVNAFYAKHNILFWHNYLDAKPLRSLPAMFGSLFDQHLKYYTPELLLVILVLVVAWLAGPLEWLGRVRSANVLKSNGRNPADNIQAGGKIMVLAFGLWLVIGSALVLSDLPPKSMAALLRDPIPSAFIAIGLAWLLVTIWTGTWRGAIRLPWRRLGAGLVFFVIVQSLIGIYPDFCAGELHQDVARVVGFSLHGLLIAITLLLAASLGASMIVLGREHVLGRTRARTLARLPSFFASGLLAYIAVYPVFTGYVYSGYFYRQAPFLVFLTDSLVAVAWYLVAGAIVRCARRLRSPLNKARSVMSILRSPTRVTSLAGLGTLAAVFVACWGCLQAVYVKAAPPGQFAFLGLLEEPPLRGGSFVVNTYAAPVAATSGSWSYIESSLFSGTLKLTTQGWQVQRDHQYLWLADGETNPAYLKPDYALTIASIPSVTDALSRRINGPDDAPDTPGPADANGLAQRALHPPQAFLHDSVVASDHANFSVVKFDWDYPPYLRPVDNDLISSIAKLSLDQRLAISANAQEMWRRWRVELEPLAEAADQGRAEVDLLDATVDDNPVFAPEDLTASGWTDAKDPNSGFRAISGNHPGTMIAVVTGNVLRLDLLKSPQGGKVRVTINDASEVIDLHANEAGKYAIVFTSGRPYGRWTTMPCFLPGLYVETTVNHRPIGDTADVAYSFAQQDGILENATTLRIYQETKPDHWSLLDAVTYLGSKGIPVRLAEFRRSNPDTVAEYQRVAAHGDRRSYEQWLADFLSESPGETNRPGIVQQALKAQKPGTEPAGSIEHRVIPLPSVSSGRLQISVAPGTSSKAGPEYFGLPFAASLPSSLPLNTSQMVAIDAAGLQEAHHLPYGDLQLHLRFPPNRQGQPEPLVSTGLEGAGDFLYVIYEDSTHVRFGFDHWFNGGPITPPIPIDYGAVHDLKISLGSLFPPEDDVAFLGVPKATVTGLKHTLAVQLDGKTVLKAAAEFYESQPFEVTVGLNTINGSTSDPAFTGKILSVERVWPQ